MSNQTYQNPLTAGADFSDEAIGRCRDVLRFVSTALPAIAMHGPAIDCHLADGALYTLDMVSDALRETEERKLPWASRPAD
jgi:hypothetical protein